MKFLKDARKLFNTFCEPISESTPHIYVSMLSLAQNESLTADHYREQGSGLGLEIVKEGKRRPSRRLKTLEAHDIRFVNSVAFSPVHHTQVLSGSEDGNVRVWDVESSELIYAPTIKHDGAVLSVALSQDATWIFSGSRDCTVRAWKVEDDVSNVIGRHDGPVMAVTTSADNTIVASGSEDGTVRLWSLNGDSIELWNPPIYVLSVLSITFRPHSSCIASSSLDGSLCVWNITTGEIQSLPLLVNESWIQSITFSLDGAHLICGTDIGNINIRDVESGTVLRQLEGHSACVHSLSLSPSGRLIASASSDKTVRIWNFEDGSAYMPFVEDGEIFSVAWSYDDQHIVSGSEFGKLSVYDATVLDTQPSVDTTGKAVEVAADIPMACAVISQDKSWIASGGNKGLVRIWKKGKADQWEVFMVCTGHTDAIWSMSISHDQQKLAAGSADLTACIWSTDDASKSPLIFNVGSGVRGVAFPPVRGSSWVATASLDGHIRIWDAQSGEVLYDLCETRQTTVSATSLAFSADGTVIASGHYDGVVRVWDIKGNCTLHTLSGVDHESSPDVVLSVAFSTNGKIAAGFRDSGAFKIWDAESGKMLLGPLQGHQARLFSLAFSPTAEHIVSASWEADGRIKLWDATTGECLSTVPRGQTQRVKSLQFSADGEWIVSSSQDATIRIWDATKFLSPAPCLRDDGWLVGAEGDLLLWIPPDLRASLLWEPSQINVLGVGFSTRLQLDGLQGHQWCA